MAGGAAWMNNRQLKPEEMDNDGLSADTQALAGLARINRAKLRLRFHQVGSARHRRFRGQKQKWTPIFGQIVN